MRKALAAVIVSAVGAMAGANAMPAKVAATCQSCHGATGDSASRDVPRLNGQQAAYIQSRLRDFLDPTKEDPHATKTMWGVVSNLDRASFAEIASYFASQPATRPSPRARSAGEGAKIFAHGASGVPACQACHGAAGQGGSAPRLAGQHGEYLTNQLERLQLGIRYSSTMHPTLKAITDAQMKAIVAYLAND